MVEMKRSDKAVELFKEGYNCSQAVFGAFADLYGMDMDTALRISSTFGAGLARMREVCGTVSGMAMVVGMETGATDGKDTAGKKANYELMQKLTDKFKEENGSIICRELLGLTPKEKAAETAEPSPRTETYYKKRPCVELVRMAAEMLEEEFGLKE